MEMINNGIGLRHEDRECCDGNGCRPACGGQGCPIASCPHCPIDIDFNNPINICLPVCVQCICVDISVPISGGRP